MKKFDTELDVILDSTEKTTKQDIAVLLGVNERNARHRISKHKCDVAVLQSPYEKGYRKAKEFDNLEDKFDAQVELNEVYRCINELERKKQIYNMQERPLIAYAVALKRYMQERGWND